MAPPPAAERPSSEAWLDIEQALDRFDQGWQYGRAPSLAEALSSLPQADRPKALQELIKLDLEYQWRRPSDQGGRFLLDHYVARHPELGPLDRLSVDLIGAEYWARQRWGDRPRHAEYATRFACQQAAVLATLLRLDQRLAEEFPAATAAPAPLAEGRASARSIATVAALAGALRRHQLITPAQMEEISRVFEGCDEPRAAAAKLIDRNWLTPYQANQLLLGRGAELVLGQYRLVERLGEGGTGLVFKARHHRLARDVAIKVIRRELLTDIDVVARFYREVQILSRMAHPNIVHAYDAGPVAGSHFLVMEYVEGTDLAKLIKQHGPLPVSRACEYIRQAASGLAHAHEHGLVHRDVKPANLLVTGARSSVPNESATESTNQRLGSIKVLDLGLARLPRGAGAPMANGTVDEGNTLFTPVGSVMMGTPDYMAPEQALDFSQADIRADVYSLGCTLYFLLTGQPPFPGGTPFQKLLRHQQADRPNISQSRADVPPELIPVLARMMAKLPEDRFATPAEVAAALVPFSDPATATQRSALSADHPARRAVAGKNLHRTLRRRRPWVVGAIALAGLALVALVLNSWRMAPNAATVSQQGPAAAGLDALRAKCNAPGAEVGDIRQQIVEFRARYPGSPESFAAGELFRLLPSPWDRLDGSKLPAGGKGPKELVATVGKSGPVYSAALSPDGNLLATYLPGIGIRLWDMAANQEKAVVPMGGYGYHGVDFSPDGKTLAWGCGIGGTFKVALLNLASKHPPQFLIEGKRTDSRLKFSPDGRTLATASGDAGMHLWDVIAEKPCTTLESFKNVSLPPAFSPDGRTLAVGRDNKVVLREVTDQHPAKQRILAAEHKGAVRVAFSPDGQRLASVGMYDREIRLWNATLGTEEARLRGHAATGIVPMFLPDGKTLASVCDTGQVLLWDVTTGHRSREILGPAGPLAAFLASPDGRHLAIVTAQSGLCSVLRLSEFKESSR
ncbi:MAG: protein kinase [Gemmataceae bacterium]|nr:protein kinase [Gemmataceae bacterium]